MKILITVLLFLTLAAAAFAQTASTIALLSPDMGRGLSVMKALSLRASASGFDTNDLRLQDLSDLVWAADGVNRSGSGKRTAPSAINAQDIDIYVIMKSGAYLYNASKHVLILIAAGDYRKLAAGRQMNFASAPVFLVLVSDISRFKSGDDSMKMSLAADKGVRSADMSSLVVHG